MREVVLAIKPKHAQDILSGTKTVELRKCFGQGIDRIFLYATSPEKAIIGCVDVKSIVRKPSKDLWEVYSSQVGISQEDFIEYFGFLEYANNRYGVAIEVYNPVYFSHEIESHRLKSEFGVNPPQSYCYLYCDGLSEKLGIK
jgi:predicted transcriptional regulator